MREREDTDNGRKARNEKKGQGDPSMVCHLPVWLSSHSSIMPVLLEINYRTIKIKLSSISFEFEEILYKVLSNFSGNVIKSKLVQDREGCAGFRFR